MRLHRLVYRATLVLLALLLGGGLIRTLVLRRELPAISGNYFAHLNRLVEEEEYERAAREFRVAIALDFSAVNKLAFYHDLGTVLNRQNRPDEALAAFEKSLPLVPAQSHRGMADAFARKGEPERALQHLRAAVRLEPSDARLHCLLGEALGSAGNVEQAESHFDQALALDPELDAAHVGMGSVRGAQNRIDEAIGHFRRALEIAPDNARAHQSLALAFSARGQLEDALVHCRVWVELQPQRAEPHSQLGQLLQRHGDLEGANAEFELARQLREANERTP